MICSNFNIELKGRKEIIKVEEVISKGERYIIIRDQHGKEHKLYRMDFYTSSSSWHAIDVGTEISVYIRESVLKLGISLAKPSIVTPVWDNISVNDYLWACEVCKKRGKVSCEEGIDPSVSIMEIYKQHESVSPECGPDKVRIFSYDFVEQTEIARLIAFRSIVD